jgi:type I restriction enzyme R subunit
MDAKLVETLYKERETKGTLHVLRHGFKFYGKTFFLGFFKPAHGLNAVTIELYKKNQICITRQVQCHPQDNSTVDIVLSMNGLPLAVIELKNPVSGQNWKHAVHQFKNDRDPRAPLFQFKKGAVVFFFWLP